MENKLKYKFIKEVVALRQQIIQLEKSEAACKRSEETLRKSEEKYRLLVENVNEAIVVIQNGKFKFFNQKAIEITGFSRKIFISKPFEEFFHPADRDAVIQRHLRRMKGEDIPSVNVFRIIDKDNRIKWVEARSVLIEWEGEPATLNFMTDVTERKQSEEALREREAHYRTLFEYASDAIFLETETQKIVDVNERACEMFGYSREEFLTMKISDLRLSDEKTLHSQARAWEREGTRTWKRERFGNSERERFGNSEQERSAALERETSHFSLPASHFSPPASHLSMDTPVEMIAKHRNGRQLLIEFTVTPLISGRQTLFMTIARDNTERRAAEEKIKYLALHDDLTGLPNRSLFFDRFNNALARGHRYQHIIALLYIDLDGFKPVNDMFGHKAGDIVLKEVAHRLSECIRETDTVARVGGDEFVIILQDLQKKEYAEIISKRIIETMTRNFCVEDKTCLVGVSIGISAYPSDGEDMDTLLQKADAAMYRVKEKGKNNYCFY